MRRFPYVIVVFGFFVLIIGGTFGYTRFVKDDAVPTPASDVAVAAVFVESSPMLPSTLEEAIPITTETQQVVSTNTPVEPAAELPPAPLPAIAVAAAATDALPAPVPTLMDAVPILTETPRVVSPHTPAETGAEPPPAVLPTWTVIPSLYPSDVPADTAVDMAADTSLIDLPGEPTEVPIIMIAPISEEDLGLFPNVQLPVVAVGSSELYVTHGDIYGTGQCFVHVFRMGEQVTGLSTAAWRLVRISGGAPPQREALVQEIQFMVAADPSSVGGCPFG